MTFTGRMVKPSIFLLFLILVSVFVVADRYGSTCTDSGLCVADTGAIDTAQGFAGTVTTSPSFTNGWAMPLIADIDNDGRKEIIVMREGQLTVFRNKSLTSFDIVGTVAYNFFASAPGTQHRQLSNPVLHNIDNDDFIEIIVVGRDDDSNVTAWMFEINETGILREEYRLVLAPTFGGSLSELQLGCGGGYCLVGFTDKSGTSNGGGSLWFYPFNGTINVSETNVGSVTNEGWCAPRIPVVQYTNFDGFNINNFIFTFQNLNRAGGEINNIWTFELNESGDHVALQSYAPFTTTGFESCGGSSCNCFEGTSGSQPLDYFTSAMAFDVTGTSANQEFIIGVGTTNNDFELRAFTQFGVLIDEFPESILGDIQGQYMSNIFLADIFTDTTTTDFCTMIPDQRTDESELHILCGSLSTGSGVQHKDLRIEFDTFNFTQVNNTYAFIGHSTSQKVNAQTTGQGTSDVSEFVTPLGILEATDISCTLGSCEDAFTILFANPQTLSLFMTNDYENTTRADALTYTTNTLQYIDDGFSKSDAQFINITYNPCINQPIKINSTFQITVIGFDADGDDINVNASVYVGTNFVNNTPWTGNITPNAQNRITTSFIYTLRNSSTNAGVTVRIRDNDQEIITQEITTNLNVRSSGNSFGECIQTTTFIVIPPKDFTGVNASLDPKANNTLARAVGETSNILGTGTKLTWVLFMFVIALAIYFVGRQHRNSFDDPSRFMAIAFIESLLLVVGSAFGFLPIGYLITILLITVVVVALIVGKKFFTNSNTGEG